MRKTYEFVSTDMDELDRLLVAGYEQFFGKTVMPGSPERLFISWVEDAIMYERAQNNWTGCQNLPSSAEGEYLDGLAELFYLQERPKPTAATCTMRFYISEPRQTAVLIPAGTRVTDDNAALYWETSADEYVPIGATYTDVQVTCQTVGTAGNDYAVGDIPYHLFGRKPLDDAESVILEPTDIGGWIMGAKAAIEDADEMNVDQAYRLTLLELNVSDTDDTENT